MPKPFSVAVIGGGIGGLTAALSLRAAGIDVNVYERTSALGDVGAGIVISPNGMRVLCHLGLEAQLAKTMVYPQAWHQRRWDDGSTLLRTPLAQDNAAVNAYGFPQVTVHRADLLDVLAGALPSQIVHLNHRVTEVAEADDGVDISFANGGRVKADVVIGADGIHSEVRTGLYGPEQPRFTGCVAYRGVLPAERVAHLDLPTEANVWMGPGRHLVHYFVRNKELISFAAAVDQDIWTSESWTNQCDVSVVLEAFKGWHPHVLELLSAVDRPFYWAMHDRAPLAQWSRGRITLLGDACHPMLPFMAQGAVQAIEDGSVLALCLAQARDGDGDVVAALQRYEQMRLPRTARIQGLAAGNKLRFHMPDGPEQQARDAEMAKGATDWSFKAVSWIYGYDATSLDPDQGSGLSH